MKAYRFGKSIILPHVRYVRNGNSKAMMMFHALIIKTKKKHQTLGCDNMDDAGFCKGHEMSRKEFVKRFCNYADSSITKNKN
jgi:hypothetical protein